MPFCTAGVEWTGPSVCSFQRSLPVRLSSAYRCMSYDPISTRSPATTGDDFTSLSVLNVQSRLPSRVLTACSMPARSPTNTASFPTAGDELSMNPSGPVAYFHRSLPVSRSIASSSPFADPTYTTPSTMAADEPTGSPVSYVQRSVSVAGSAAAAAPVRCELPRNCGQPGAGVCADSEQHKSNDENTKTRRREVFLLRSRIGRQREELIAIVDEQRAVRRHRGRVDGAAH